MWLHAAQSEAAMVRGDDLVLLLHGPQKISGIFREVMGARNQKLPAMLTTITHQESARSRASPSPPPAPTTGRFRDKNSRSWPYDADRRAPTPLLTLCLLRRRRGPVSATDSRSKPATITWWVVLDGDGQLMRYL